MNFDNRGVLQSESFQDHSSEGSLDLVSEEDQRQKRCGHWSQKEHTLYLKFLDQLTKPGHPMKKGQPMFKQMSKIVMTRTPSQCRSHHQKFNPNISRRKRVKRRLQITASYKPFLKSKQIMRQYFANLKRDSPQESDDD